MSSASNNAVIINGKDLFSYLTGIIVVGVLYSFSFYFLLEDMVAEGVEQSNSIVSFRINATESQLKELSQNYIQVSKELSTMKIKVDSIATSQDFIISLLQEDQLADKNIEKLLREVIRK